MPKTATPSLPKVTHKKKSRKSSKGTTTKRSGALSICPVNGAGWCPYPFSVEQLERRLKAKAAAAKLKDS